MKFLHVSDLHIGKKFNDVNLLDDQKFVLAQIENAAEKCDAVIIAGDVYDKTSPSADAMSLFDGFLSSLAGKNIPVFIISGNHDSGQRVGYLSELVEKQGICICGEFKGNLPKYRLEDEFGEVFVYLLPFIKPSDVRRFFPDEKIDSYDDAVRIVIENAGIDMSARNVIAAHQFVTGAQTCDSEVFAVGGLDNISAENFDAFEYAALGHIHGSQFVSRPEVRYCGSPLKYSFSEERHHKSVTIAELREKGNTAITAVPLECLHDVREVKGSLAELMELPYSEDYVRVVVTDENVPPDARVSLRTVFPNMMKFMVENSKTALTEVIDEDKDVENKSPIELFRDFYMLMNNDVPPSSKHVALVQNIIERLGESSYDPT